MDFDTFSSTMRTQGFDQVVERVWEPFATADDHTHPFDAKAVMVKGEMWLTVNGHTDHLRAGGTFELPAGLLHSERYGPEGATYWVARRSRA